MERKLRMDVTHNHSDLLHLIPVAIELQEAARLIVAGADGFDCPGGDVVVPASIEIFPE